MRTRHKLATACWSDSNNLEIGDEVIAIENPLGVGMSVSTGIVSALNRNINSSPFDDIIPTRRACSRSAVLSPWNGVMPPTLLTTHHIGGCFDHS